MSHDSKSQREIGRGGRTVTHSVGRPHVRVHRRRRRASSTSRAANAAHARARMLARASTVERSHALGVVGVDRARTRAREDGGDGVRRARARARARVSKPSNARRRGETSVTTASTASMASNEPSDEDVKAFNALLSARSWEEIVGNVKREANEGRLTSGTLGAGYAVYSEAKKRGESEQTLMILQNIIQVVTQAVLTLDASPAQRVMDELMEFSTTEERRLVDKLEEAYNDGISTYDVAEILRDFIKNLQVQEMSFDLEVAKAKEAGWAEQLTKLEKLAEERIEAQRRAMNILRLIGGASPAAPGARAAAPAVPGASAAASKAPEAAGGFFADQSD